MNRPLLGWVALVITIPAGAADPPESTKFEDLKPLIETVAKADKVVLYEGLPHPFNEPELFEWEKKAKKMVTIAGWPFYTELLDLKDADKKKLVELLGQEKTFYPYRGPAKCGGFHPDYAVEWRVNKDTYYALICFGCNEAKVYAGDKAVLVKLMVRKGDDPLGDLLKPYRKSRPKPKD
jgi:hypothetical protein